MVIHGDDFMDENVGRRTPEVKYEMYRYEQWQYFIWMLSIQSSV